ncbi:hypothetical protein [Lysobacter sp. CA199]|uniref:hypothetical protein n=1 Tax=Lysobacter sp. CA199 TaxID=3455608 RepID=UPI003F8D617C
MAWANLIYATPPPFLLKWKVDSIRVGLGRSIPISCEFPTVAASNAWNGVGANFYFVFDNSAHPRVAEQTRDFDSKNVTIEDGVMTSATAIMETIRYESTLSGALINADIYADRDRLSGFAPGKAKLNCYTLDTLPADKIDWQSTILHELGHALGFEHTPDEPTCSMYGELKPGENRRNLCEVEKQAFIAGYKMRFNIVSIPHAEGPQNVDVPVNIIYDGNPKFPLKRNTVSIECPNGWSCPTSTGAYSSNTPSPLTFRLKCTPSDTVPTATFRWRTTLTEANGFVTNAIEHTTKCISPEGARRKNSSYAPSTINRVVINN